MASNRFWFYFLVIIIVAGLLTVLYTERSRLDHRIASLNDQSYQLQRQQLQSYLDQQTDARKLVSLAKHLATGDQRLLGMIIDRAYQLNPNSRDIALLASNFHPELKKRVQELDPLYQFK
jgi:hypothetical protein